MKKNKRGITLLELALTIVIMIILSGVILMKVSGQTGNTKTVKFASEIYQIKQSVEHYYFRKGVYPVSSTTRFSLNDVGSSNMEQFAGETIQGDNTIELSIIDLNEIGINENELGKGKDALDYYAYSASTNKIYYLKGKEIKNKKYYTLTSELYDSLGVGNVR